MQQTTACKTALIFPLIRAANATPRRAQRVLRPPIKSYRKRNSKPFVFEIEKRKYWTDKNTKQCEKICNIHKTSCETKGTPEFRDYFNNFRFKFGGQYTGCDIAPQI